MATRKTATRPQSKSSKKISEDELRLYVSATCLLIFAGIICLRLLYIQVLEVDKYRNIANTQYIINIPKEAQRGLIYDRNMSVLALNEPCISVGLDKTRMQGSARHYARALARVLNKSESWIKDRIDAVSGNFVWLSRRIDANIGVRIAALNLSGIRVEKDTRRNYPHHEMTGHVLGFTDADNKGIEGVEFEYNTLLTGKDGWALILRDGRGRAVPESVVENVDPHKGHAIQLTIDALVGNIDSTIGISRPLHFGAVHKDVADVDGPAPRITR